MTAVQILWGNPPAKAVPSIWQDVCGSVARWDTSGRSAIVEGAGVVNEMEQGVSQEYREDEIETMSINSVYLNKN